MTDEQLISAIREHDRAAFGQLYDRYSGRLLLLLRRMMNNDNEKAQDILHDAFIRVLRSAGRFEHGKSFKTWIYTIAVNLCKNEYRRLSVRQNIGDGVNLETIPQKDQNAEQKLDLAMFRQALNIELDKLPAYLRSTFLLRFQSGMTIREIAEIMNCSQGTVKSRLFYLMQNLAEVLKSYNPYNIEAT